MLEVLLNFFRSTGMDDLEFIIINTKLSHARDNLPQLQSLVSFNVYQETEEEEVWSVMEGGKDDMFIYDRCGRLTYFVPYPLSILKEHNAVMHAIISTYFENPCGGNCNASVDEFFENTEMDEEYPATETNYVYDVTEQLLDSNNASKEESSNDLLYIGDYHFGFDAANTSDFNNASEIEHPFSNITEQSKEENTTTGEENRGGYLNILYKLFSFNTDTNYQPGNDSRRTVLDNETANYESERQLVDSPPMQNEPLHAHEHNHNQSHKYNRTHLYEHNHNQNQGNKQRDRCVEADHSVCKHWSKQRLLRAQKCCSLKSESQAENQNKNNCQNFSKRRCKKIQSILKCCIKTTYTETTEDASLQEKAVNEVADVVCCKTSSSGKICRTSESKDCGEGEIMENSLHNTKCENQP